MRKFLMLFISLTCVSLYGSIPDIDPDTLLCAYYKGGTLHSNVPQEDPSTQKGGGPSAFSYRPAIESTGLFLGAEFLYWKMDECGMDYAYTNNKAPITVFGSPAQSIVGDLLSVDFSWDPGVRGWLGYRFPNRYWEAEGEYTYYYTDANKTTERGTGVNASLVGTFPEFFGGVMQRASSHQHFHYHVARAHLARRFLVGDTIFLRFFAGPQGAWIDQTWTVIYTGDDLDRTKHDNNWEYEGGGIHIGMNSDWYLGAGFSFFFNGALASLYGSHRVFSAMELAGSVGTGTLQNFNSNDHRVAHTTQISAGIAWGIVLDWFAIKAFASYELNTWFNLQEQYRVDLAGGAQNPLNEKVRILTTCPVNLQGITAGLSLEF